MTIIFLIACVTAGAVRASYSGLRFSATVIVSLLVCLIPTTIGGCCPRSHRGMDRLIRHNVIR